MGPEEIKQFVLGSIISADNDEFTEEQKQEVIRRYELEKGQSDLNWEFILEPVDTTGKLLKLFV